MRRSGSRSGPPWRGSLKGAPSPFDQLRATAPFQMGRRDVTMKAVAVTGSASAHASACGHFSEDGREYVITRHDTPRPWVNVLCNDQPGYGVIISQAGSGYSWLGNAELNRITAWQQDLIEDNRGKFVYLRDEETGEFWSAAYQPVRRTPDEYECRHGVGYSTITQAVSGIRSQTTVFVPPQAAMEVWLVEVENISARAREITLISYLEWCLGTAHDTHREFHRTFIETEFRPDSAAILARKRLWAIPNDKGQGWNRDWDGTAFHICSGAVSGFECDREAFIGMYRDLAAPRAVVSGELTGSCGKWGDGIASLKTRLSLAPGERKSVVFAIGRGASGEDALDAASCCRDVAAASILLEHTRSWWLDRLEGFEVSTPDTGLNHLLNTWLRYQAMAGRIWGRSGYYQPGGAFGFRDQLQDSHVFLPTEPERARRQILLHAAHQFVAGNVFHWWQPITESGAPSRYSDDLLWLPYVVSSYISETAERSILDEQAPYVDAPAEPLSAHCFRALDLSLSRVSPRGLPLIGEGDWNDGLSAAGWEGRGESVWVGMFQEVILPEWAAIADSLGETERAERYRRRAEDLRRILNREAWDGRWYLCATCDDGSPIGGHSCEEGRIFLNPQTWAIISGVCPPDRREALMKVTRKMLYAESGPALLRPAYTRPDGRIGYLTRYAPACRENGGTYLHAATWAIWAECLMQRPDAAWDIYRAISPVERGLDANRYRAEPYVTAGNIDGPDSPNCGRGGWSWYSGSAAWLFKVMTERVLGVRPEEDGLRVDPCLPPHWTGFGMIRRFQGCLYRISVRATGVSRGTGPILSVDGRAVTGQVVPAFADGREHRVDVEI